jgi:hypothetical protein
MQIKIPSILARDSDSFVLRKSTFTHSTFSSVLLISAHREYSTSSVEFQIWETSEKRVIYQLSAVQKQFTIFSKFLQHFAQLEQSLMQTQSS